MDPREVIDEVTEAVKRTKEIDFVTFSGSGEPTLNSDIGFMIEEVKKATSVPVAVITNGSLLYQAEVRRDLAHADVVLPSLDAVSEDIFRYINRPHSLLEIETIIRGLKLFRTEYTGKVWLEIMLIKNVNDRKDELNRFIKVLSEIKADKIHLNTVTRPPCDEARGHLTIEELEGIRDLLGPGCDIIGSFEKSVSEAREDDWSTSVVEILKRRSLTLEDIVQITGVTPSTARDRLKILEEEGLIVSYVFHDSLFYKMP